MNEAYRFQHKLTGLQILVFHKSDSAIAKMSLCEIGLDPDDWSSMGKCTINIV